MTDKFIWANIKNDVKKMAQCCLACQKAKVHRHNKTPVGSFTPVVKRFAEIHLDIIGPLPESEGQRYCVTIIDRFTRWTEAAPVPDIRADTVASAIFNTWISRFGIPTSIVTDQGSQFESELFSEFSKLLGFERKRTTAYHPQCNGFIERWHRTLKAAIMCHQNKQWTRVLPAVLLGLRTSYREDFKTSSAELVFGEPIRIPSDMLVESRTNQTQSEFVNQLREHFAYIRPPPPARHQQDKIFISKDLNSCSHVLTRTDSVRKSLQTPYEGPFLVIKRCEKYFTIDIRGKHCNISIDRLKPCFIEENETGSTLKEPNEEVTKKQLESTKTHHKVKFNLEPHRVSPIIPNNKPSTTRTGRIVKIPSRFA